jgi:hypothetical protein
MQREDLSGLALARMFFDEAVAPIVARVAPALRYTAGRIGDRSDAFGFDDAISRDHGWGPGCTLLIDPAAYEDIVPRLDAALRAELPVQFRGYPTSYAGMHLAAVAAPPIEHGVELSSPDRFLRRYLGAAPVHAIDWLAANEQKLLEVTSGELFRDDLGFAATRAQLARYPDDVRRHLIAVEWMKINDEQAFPARAGSRGDQAGAAIVAARLAESAMRLAFYVERAYPPYGKWFGTAFRRLACGPELHEAIASMLVAAAWEPRDRAWAEVLRRLLALHERAGLIAPGKYQPAPVYTGRPGIGLPGVDRGVPSMANLIEDLRAPIRDPGVLAIPPRIGSINQLLASRDLDDDVPRWRAWFTALVTAR